MFGGQVVTFISRTPGPPYSGVGTPTITETATAVEGCRHRPLTYQETAELQLDVATEWWRSTVPPEAVARNAKHTDLIEVDGQRYQIEGGVRCYPDMEGRPFKVTIVSKKHIS